MPAAESTATTAHLPAADLCGAPDGAKTTDSPGHAARAALAALDSLLDPGLYITVLITGDNRVPRLTVSSRYARLTWDVYADEGWYWSGPDKVAPFSDPGAAARDLADVLG